jgi:hypothetical protein
MLERPGKWEKTHIYKCRTLKIKLEIKFHFAMIVKEVDARISNILKYYLKNIVEIPLREV